MTKQISLFLSLLMALVLALPAAPALSAEIVEVFIHAENQSQKMTSLAISPWSYTTWNEDRMLPAGKTLDLQHTEVLDAGGGGISYELFVSRMSGDATCLFWYRYDHDGSKQLILSEPEFRNCQFDSSISHTAHREGNKMYVTIIVK